MFRCRCVSELLRWWLFRVMKGNEKTASYPVRIAERRGLPALRQRPQVILGTIHSVKGGEADTVFLCPDISYPAHHGWILPGEEHDAIVRQFYVGMTRARQRLVICEPSGEQSVNI